MDPLEVFWKMIGALGVICAGALWAFKVQADSTRRQTQYTLKFEDMQEQIDQLKENYKLLLEINNKMGYLETVKMQIRGLQEENKEVKNQNRTVLEKLDGLKDQMNDIKLDMKDKLDR